jgi:hypothetical protein
LLELRGLARWSHLAPLEEGLVVGKKIRAEVRQLWILNVTVLACEEAT